MATENSHTSKKRDAQPAYASRIYVKYGIFIMSAAAAEHAIFEQHGLDFDNLEVIDYEHHGMKRRDKEALCINAEKNPMNKDKWNRTQSGSASPPPLFVVFQKPLLTLSLSYLLGTYSFP